MKCRPAARLGERDVALEVLDRRDALVERDVVEQPRARAEVGERDREAGAAGSKRSSEAGSPLTRSCANGTVTRRQPAVSSTTDRSNSCPPLLSS